ncbi:MAG: PSD1 and planctomycete cytochrome C domain-containing protein [Verrucomicrobiales bacterium]|nr:PSD1 and planctomycete cytochrome C domain-containing protein [Verrucomicrobiales bacterium]
MKRFLLIIPFSFLLFDVIAEQIDFNRDVRPILSQNCYVCHGPDKAHRKAKLRLDIEEGSREVVAISNASQSELIARITSKDPEEVMPTIKSGKALTSDEIDILTKWVRSGAKYVKPWAYISPIKTKVPESAPKEWTHNWIDSFLLAHWAREVINPAQNADSVTLIRRLSFDLLGLPPNIETVQRFKKAKDVNFVYESIVDEFLSSESFGERMTSYWLDLVRFADTVGYHGDQDHNITPYRDYVLNSFNQNLPFDQFTREQLAGDLLNGSTIDQRIATGYNRLLQTSHEGGVQAREYLAIYAADRIRNLSGVWMGATLGCAQCHDHKYDPYTARDFYAMSAFFADVDESKHFAVGSNSLPTKRPPEISVISRKDREYLKSLEVKVSKTKETEDLIKKIKSRSVLTMVTQSIEPRVTRILPRGNWLDESGEIVQPAIPEFLGKIDTGDRRATRLDLANWLTDSNNGIGGLTARVFVNRLWYLFFGEGISSSLDDFGGQGSPPVLPNLLDNLSVYFYENDWDVKKMVKLIVMSRAYKLSSRASNELKVRDPLNKLFARQSRYRLPAEMIRDNALVVGGLLVNDYGGSSIKPYQPKGYYRHLNFPKREYVQHQDDRRYKRSVYMHWQRQFLHPLLKAMDAPSREECVAKRSRSNTPVAAMVLLNDPSFYESAESFTKNLLKTNHDNEEDRIIDAFRRALSRTPSPQEKDVLINLFKDVMKGDQGKEDAEMLAWTAVSRAIFNCSEFNTRN